MEEKANTILNKYTGTLRAYFDIDVHRTFYESIVENEEITLGFNRNGKLEIITSKGFTFCVFHKLHVDLGYIYYAIKAGAVFKGYISDIDGKGFFDVHVFQYVCDGYKDPKKIPYTKTVYGAFGVKRHYTSKRYEQEIEEEIKASNRALILSIIFFPIYLVIAPIIAIASILDNSVLFGSNGKSDLEKQIREQENRFREYDNEMLQQRFEKKQQIEKQRRLEEEKRRKEEEWKEYERKRQIEYERTHEKDVAIINSLKKPDKFGNILCPKCCSIVVAKFGHCPKCKTKFQLDYSEKNDL